MALLVAAGCRNTEIARRLQISEQTVRNHLKAIVQCLGVASRLQLAVYVHRLRFGRRRDGA